MGSGANAALIDKQVYLILCALLKATGKVRDE